MTKNEFIKFFDRVTYKPSVTFAVKDLVSADGCNVRIAYEATYNYRFVTDRTRVYTFIRNTPFTSALVERHTEQTLLEWLYETILELEIHEVKEWLKVDNQWVKNPHPEINDAAIKVYEPKTTRNND